MTFLIPFLGYANEIGEAFRSIVPNSIVWLSYAVASGYVLADTINNGFKAYQVSNSQEKYYLNMLYILIRLL